MARDRGRETRYVCDYCGYQGVDRAAQPAERIQCPMCGEPVTPLD